MTALEILIPALCAAGVALFLVGDTRRNDALRAVGKGAASVGFVVFALLAGAPRAGLPGGLVVAALVLSLLGDLLLLPRGAGGAFLAGIGCFFLAHVALAAAFSALGASALGLLVGALPTVVAAVAVGRWLLPRAGRLAPAVAGYIAAISAMIVTASGAAFAAPRPERWAILGGAALFAVSDVFVARERFVTATPWNERIALPLYYAAQLLFGGLVAGAAALR